MARQEAARQEAARADAAARREAQRLEAARLEAARRELARQEAERQEAQRAASARLEAERQEAARQEAARRDLAQQDAARQEAQRADAARLETARLDAARQEAAAKREARLREIGQQLDREAAQRDAAAAAARLAAPNSARRGRLFGRTDSNAELVLYAEALARKIEMNMTIDMVRDAIKKPYTDPVVTLAIRSDGTVESVTLVVSSGVVAIDEAIPRIVQSQANYPAFTPLLARDYDVIEIRRTWHFDVAVRLY